KLQVRCLKLFLAPMKRPMCRSLENFRTPRFHWHLRRGRAKQPARLSMRPRTCPQFENAPARSEPELVNLRWQRSAKVPGFAFAHVKLATERTREAPPSHRRGTVNGQECAGGACSKMRARRNGDSTHCGVRVGIKEN